MQTRWAVIFFLILAVAVQAANLIPNSSFEAGPGRGWINFNNGDNAFLGNLSDIGGLLTNDAQHGVKSLISKGPTYSRGIWLTNGSYTLSLYARSPSGTAGPFIFGMLNGAGLYDHVPATSTNLTASWVRYSSPFTASSNGFYWVKFYTFQAVNFHIDALQLEPGASATTYEPQAIVEAGLSIPNTNGVWFSGDAPKFNLNFWNNGIATNANSSYSVFDLWNSNVISSQFSVLLAASTNTAVTVTLPDRTGWFRVVSRVQSINDSGDEATMIVYPFASNIVANASTDWLGGHPHASPFHVRRELLVNRKWGRILSPNYAGTRWEFIEPTRGNFSYNDFTFTNLSAGGMTIVAPLTPGDGNWPTWATNANGTADLMAFSNYCYQVVNRYKTHCTHWEIGPNEPYQSGPTTPINVQQATNYAQVLTYGIRGVTNADASAKIIAIAGAYGAGEWAWEAWTNLTAASQAAVSYVSTHIYPQDNGTDPNSGEYEATHFSHAGGWIQRFGGIKPVWNTESGNYGLGALKGLNSIWPGAYDLNYPFSPEAVRSEAMNRQLSSTVRILTQALRCIGHGFEKYFYYDSRFFNEAAFLGTQPYPADYLQVDRPEIASLSVATHFLRRGFGKITNSAASSLLEMYSFTNSAGNPVIAAWNADRTNRTLTLTNSGFAVYDAMGNQIQTNAGTARVTRLPRYFVSSTLTLAQFSNTLAYASLAGVADTQAPQVSFDIAPIGLWDGQTNAALVKWTALDDTWTAWTTPGTATNVVYRWKLDSGTYSAYSQSNHVWLPNLSVGNHTIYVDAMDANGNSSEVGYVFDAISYVNRRMNGKIEIQGNVAF